MSSKERISLSFTGKEELEIYEFLKATKNASALVRYLTRLYMDGYIPNPIGMSFGKQKANRESILLEPEKFSQPQTESIESNSINSSNLRSKNNYREIEEHDTVNYEVYYESKLELHKKVSKTIDK